MWGQVGGGLFGLLPAPDIVGQFMRGVAVVGAGVAGLFATAAGVIFTAPALVTAGVVLGAVVAVGIIASAINSNQVSYNAVAAATTDLRTRGQAALYAYRNSAWVIGGTPNPQDPCDPKDTPEFRLAPYRPSVTKYNNHHAIYDAWAKVNVPGYRSRAKDNPTVRMPAANHAQAHQAAQQWLEDRGLTNFDIKNLSIEQIFELSEVMFDAAGVPFDIRGAFYDSIFEYFETGRWKGC
jgi:hypothetical protein